MSLPGVVSQGELRARRTPLAVIGLGAAGGVALALGLLLPWWRLGSSGLGVFDDGLYPIALLVPVLGLVAIADLFADALLGLHKPHQLGGFTRSQLRRVAAVDGLVLALVWYFFGRVGVGPGYFASLAGAAAVAVAMLLAPASWPANSDKDATVQAAQPAPPPPVPMAEPDVAGEAPPATVVMPTGPATEAPAPATPTATSTADEGRAVRASRTRTGADRNARRVEPVLVLRLGTGTADRPPGLVPLRRDVAAGRVVSGEAPGGWLDRRGDRRRSRRVGGGGRRRTGSRRAAVMRTNRAAVAACATLLIGAMTAPAARADTWGPDPGPPQVTFSISGVTLDPPARAGGSATYTGRLQPNGTLRVSGSGNYHLDKGYATNLGMSVNVTVDGKSDTYAWPPKGTSGSISGPFDFSGSFNVSVPIPANPKGGSFGISFRNCNDDGVCGGAQVEGTFTGYTPLCDEALAFFGLDPAKAAAQPSGILVSLSQLDQGFRDAAAAYQKAHGANSITISPPDQSPYWAGRWLFGYGGGGNHDLQKAFSFTDPDSKTVIDVIVAEGSGALASGKYKAPHGTEAALAQDIVKASVAGSGHKLTPGEVFGLALGETGGDGRKAMLLAHNALRGLARGDEGDSGGVRSRAGLLHGRQEQDRLRVRLPPAAP